MSQKNPLAYTGLVSASTTVQGDAQFNPANFTVVDGVVSLSGGGMAMDTAATDSGNATPTGAGVITWAGGTNIATAGAGSTVTINMDAAISLATSVTSPLYLAPAATAMEIRATAGQNLSMQMGDAAASNKISFEDSASVEVAQINSDGAMTALSYATSDAASGLTISGNDIDADGTDVDISIVATPKGTGVFQVDSGGMLISAGDVINTHSSAAVDVTIEVTNSDNTSGSSRAGFEAAVGGTSSGDAYFQSSISGGQAFTWGVDNSTANDDWVLSDSTALGTNNRISIDGTSGDVSIATGNLIIATAAKQLQVEGGAATDFIGQATLTAGTVTVNNTNIAANDRVFVTRSDASTSTALGVLDVSISAGASFTIDARNPTDATVQTNDVSVIDYFIVRQL